MYPAMELGLTPEPLSALMVHEKGTALFSPESI
jgi:hypothetical protein